METCEKCTPGTIAIDDFQLYDRNTIANNQFYWLKNY